jgi:amidohydrolase
MIPKIRPEIQKLEKEIITLRRDFHRHPELGFEVQRTAGVIADQLQTLGLEVKTGVGKTGVVGEIVGAKPGPCIALRADMDALPIQETNNVSYRSEIPGVMHACGHDGHTAMLLGVARVLAGWREKLRGTVRLIFQPAEEGEAGAVAMIADGCLEGVDEIYGLHLWNYQSYGEVGVKEGPILAAADKFEIVVKGTGGHGAAPQGTVDAIVVAAEIISTLQTIVSRNTNPLESTVVSVGKISGGHNFNVIADKVTLQGTVRAYTETNRQMVKKRLQDILNGFEQVHGAEIDLHYDDKYPPTVNAPLPTEKVFEAAREIVGSKAGTPYLSMGGEDFSYYTQQVPGCFFFVGSAPQDQDVGSVPHHCSHFDFEEQAMLVGSSILIQLIENLLITQE